MTTPTSSALASRSTWWIGYDRLHPHRRGALRNHSHMVGVKMIDKIGTMALIAALVACLGLAGALWWQSSDMDRLEADNARLERNANVMAGQIDQARQSAAVAAAHAQRERDLNAKASATIEAIRNLQLGECADAPLDPDLADLLGRRDVPTED